MKTEVLLLAELIVTSPCDSDKSSVISTFDFAILDARLISVACEILPVTFTVKASVRLDKFKSSTVEAETVIP